MERKALFLDMDGTTLNDEIQIPKENYEAMEAAAKAGHEIVITTGRPYASARGGIWRGSAFDILLHLTAGWCWMQ